ncbi:hypothetical protein CDAR_494921, partial [Caerostris darwini]
HVFSSGNGPLQDHLQVPSSSAAAEAMLTEPPLLSDADHCGSRPSQRQGEGCGLDPTNSAESKHPD